MLTAFQCATGAYATEDGDIICLTCFEDGGRFVREVSNYELDEVQSARSYDDGWCAVAGWPEDQPEGWVCEGCEYPLHCDACGAELREAYEAGGCGVPEADEGSDEREPWSTDHYPGVELSQNGE